MNGLLPTAGEAPRSIRLMLAPNGSVEPKCASSLNTAVHEAASTGETNSNAHANARNPAQYIKGTERITATLHDAVAMGQPFDPPPRPETGETLGYTSRGHPIVPRFVADECWPHERRRNRSSRSQSWRDDDRLGTRREHEPASEHPAVGAQALLALQRSSGNQAVARMVQQIQGTRRQMSRKWWEAFVDTGAPANGQQGANVQQQPQGQANAAPPPPQQPDRAAQDAEIALSLPGKVATIASKLEAPCS